MSSILRFIAFGLLVFFLISLSDSTTAFLFYIIWAWFLIGLYQLLSESVSLFTSKWTKLIPGIVIGSFLLEIGRIHEEHKVQRESWTSYVFTSQKEDVRWKMSPPTVTCIMIGRLLILIADIFGATFGSFVSGFINRLPLLVQVPAYASVVFLLPIGFFACFGYNFDFGYGLVRIRQNGAREVTTQGVVKVVNELYQRTSPFARPE